MTTRTDHNTGSPATKADRCVANGEGARRGLSPVGRKLLLAAAALAALSGCGGPERWEFIPGCPNVGVLRDAGSLRIAGPDGTLSTTVLMTNLQSQCEYDDTGVTVLSTLTVRAEPAAGVSDVPFEYFVAVTDPNRNVLSKQIFASRVDTSGGVGFVLEDLVQFIPAPKTVDARYYEVLVGFQMPPDQVEANRRVNDSR